MCGQLIHPIAGRCKHCKGDLRAMRSTRPAAIASLPSLLANAQGEPTYTPGNRNGHGSGARGQLNGNGHAAGAPGGHVAMPQTPAAIPERMLEDGSQPILPPRPTGRMVAAQGESGWFGRNWPLLVIATACVAILIALVLMVIPHVLTKDADAGTKSTKLTPAPERMDTNPLVPSDPPRAGGNNGPDPWDGKNGGGIPKPPDIDIPDDPDVDDPDPVPVPNGGGQPQIQGAGAITMGMMQHACSRAKTCGKLDQTVEEYCDEIKKWPVAPPPASCGAAQRCFNHIDEMSCSMDFDVASLSAVQHKFEDCIEAIGC